MQILLQLEYWQAVRLQSLVNDGRDILQQQGRNQRGIDGYTMEDLDVLDQYVSSVKDSPRFVSKFKIEP
jgi:hypothetical protein